MHLLLRNEHSKEHDAFTRLDTYAREKVDLANRLIMGAYERKQITESNTRSLLAALSKIIEEWDEAFDHFDQIFKDLTHAIQHHGYYDAIDRYERGQAMLEQEMDAGMQARYRKRLAELAAEIERLTPKGASA